MAISFRLMALCPLALAAFAAGESSAVSGAANRVEQAAAKTPAPLAMEFRMTAAQALQARYPELAREFVDAALAQLRAGVKPDAEVVRALAEVAPAEAVSLVPKLGPDSTLALIAALGPAGHVAEAGRLFQDMAARVSFDAMEPADVWPLLNLAHFAPTTAADFYERVLQAASAPDYGRKARSSVTATFRVGSANIATDNSRDALLVSAGVRLRALEPERAAKFQSVLGRWDLAGPLSIRSVRLIRDGAASPSANPPEVNSIQQRIGKMRGLPTDADRAKLAIEVAKDIRALPPGPAKLSLANSICNLATEGDLGKEALAAVAAALEQAMRETPADAGAYFELASLVRYEHVPAPPSDPSLDAADAVLALRQQMVQGNDFTLPGLDGKQYTLRALRGRVVLVNFWATWCPPCRKEMPDMEKLYRAFEKKGFTVLAISDEARETVAGYLQKQDYTFPILLDPGGTAHAAFGVSGIPKSFLFDREGNLAAEAMDMRTERQFLEMLKSAGLE
ncbi:MAG TPA: TlpA disulfide reductase family protein [Bryobacteraceae bacterium]|nr:TlpA disulfide reductase family protein [Bryobacteraceae bacterium]